MTKRTIDLPPHPDWDEHDRDCWKQLPYIIDLKFAQIGRTPPTNEEFNNMLKYLLTPMPEKFADAIRKVAGFLNNL